MENLELWKAKFQTIFRISRENIGPFMVKQVESKQYAFHAHYKKLRCMLLSSDNRRHLYNEKAINCGLCAWLRNWGCFLKIANRILLR